MGLQWAHTECIGQGQGLSVVGFGLLDFWRIVMHRDLAQEPEGLGFYTSLLTFLRIAANNVTVSPSGRRACVTNASSRSSFSPGAASGGRRIARVSWVAIGYNALLM
jgi:hypothetical protein